MEAAPKPQSHLFRGLFEWKHTRKPILFEKGTLIPKARAVDSTQGPKFTQTSLTIGKSILAKGFIVF